MKPHKNIIISRTDSIGDVILTLPLCGILKNKFPDVNIIFLGKDYVKAVVESSIYVDRFISFDEFDKMTESNAISFLKGLQANSIIHVFPNKKIAKYSKKAQIPIKIGTNHRIFHLFTCNKKVKLSRKKSNLHEAQLNIKLLKPLGIKTNHSLPELSHFYGFNKISPLKPEFKTLLDPNKFNLIIHPKSKGSAREWGTDNFSRLIKLLPQENFKLFVSGTSSEAELIKEFLTDNKNLITDITGKMDLEQFISFISNADGLLAASTGPLHIAAATGINAIGIFAPMRPIHPGRWQPVGKNADYVVINKECNKCQKSEICECILEITPKTVFQKIISLKKFRNKNYIPKKNIE